MERYNLTSDACDYRLIRVNNCLQVLACVCDLLALADRNLRKLSNVIDHLADTVYHTISGCMTAQVAHELNQRRLWGDKGQGYRPVGQRETGFTAATGLSQHHHPQQQVSYQQQQLVAVVAPVAVASPEFQPTSAYAPGAQCV